MSRAMGTAVCTAPMGRLLRRKPYGRPPERRSVEGRQPTVEGLVSKMLEFYGHKRIFVTGHTGFKGSWLCTVLAMAGAEVTGFALPPAASPSLWELCGLEGKMPSIYGDIRDLDALWSAFERADPEIVFHLAAQPIVRESYRDPVSTYSTNVMGTVHILECVRRSQRVKSFLNVTTDKVYENRGRPRGCREADRLNGFDPYANSKSCSELVTDSYKNCFFSDGGPAVSTARAGNVIGGGDFAADRIIPDCVRAVQRGEPVQLRSPHSVRPYQHVLEPLSAYLLIAQRQYEDAALAGSYNVGPDSRDCLTTGELADLFCKTWGPPARWEHAGREGPHEDAVLRLDCAKISAALGWKPRWSTRRAVEETVAWTKAWLRGEAVSVCMREQIAAFFGESGTIG